MPEIKKKMKVEMAQPSEKEKNEPNKEREVPEGESPIWNFPLQGRSVRARNLAEAKEKIKTKE